MRKTSHLPAALAFALALCAATPVLAGYNEGMVAYDRGRYADALSEFKPLAEGGHLGAEFMLGAMYFYGNGVRRDDALAAIWFHKAAIQGNASAQLAFGSLHIRGLGVRQDLVKAYMWLTVAADTGPASLGQEAIKLRDEATRLMTPGEVGEALRRSATWSPSRSNLTAKD